MPDNSFPYDAATHLNYIREYAKSIGLDPDIAAAFAQAEGSGAWSANNPAAQSNIYKGGVREPSYGDFQLYTSGLGAQAKQAGIDITDPNQWQGADRFALNYMKTYGFQPWSSDAAYKKYGSNLPAPTGGPPASSTGTTLNTNPAGATSGPSAASQFAQGNIMGGLGTAFKNPNVMKGLQQLGGGGRQQQQAPAPPQM